MAGGIIVPTEQALSSLIAVITVSLYILGIIKYPIMPGKPQWPAVATLTADNIREHGHMLGIYIDTALALMDKGHKPPPGLSKAFLQATLTFITKTK